MKPSINSVSSSNIHNPSLPDLFFATLSLLFVVSSSSTKPHRHLLKTLKPPTLKNPLRLFLPLKSPPMPKTPSPNKPSSLDFSSPQSLSDWLKSRVPSESLAAWGVKPGTKTVDNLWLELSQGEISLLDSTPPLRTVHVATIRIRGPNGKFLIESHQELSNGTVRSRFRPLSEKMKPEETVEEAVMRAIREELGSLISNCDDEGVVKIVPGSYERREEERVSASYPGLPARYILHSVDAWVEGLPDVEFCTEEEEYGGCSDARVAENAIFVKRHSWKWVESFDSV